MHELNRHELALTTGLLGMYTSGRVLQFFNIDLTGNVSVDDFMKYNFDSIVGAPMFSLLVANLLRKYGFGDHASLLVAGAGLSAVIYAREVRDAAEYGHGIDFVDLYGGLSAIVLCTLFCLSTKRK